MITFSQDLKSECGNCGKLNNYGINIAHKDTFFLFNFFLVNLFLHYSVVFAGFSSEALASRINDGEA